MSESSLLYVEGDLFTAPDHSILVHACNTLGSWSSGIALTFRQKFPAEFAQYKAHCDTYGEALVGTCLLIPGDKHDIACLFTSRAPGISKDKPADILAATRNAVTDLEAKNIDNKPLHACRINSGQFAVPWEDTEAILKDLGVHMTVYTPIDAPVKHQTGFRWFWGFRNPENQKPRNNAS